MGAHRPLAPENGDVAGVREGDGGTHGDGAHLGRYSLALGDPRGDHKVGRWVVADDPQGIVAVRLVGDGELVGDGCDVLVGAHARQGRSGLVAQRGRAQHRHALFVDLVQAGRRVDDEVGAEPALGEAELGAHPVEGDEPAEDACGLGERENEDDRGAHRVCAQVLEGNEAQRERTGHCPPPPTSAQSIHRAGRTP